jgi:hypothetical protein
MCWRDVVCMFFFSLYYLDMLEGCIQYTHVYDEMAFSIYGIICGELCPIDENEDCGSQKKKKKE